MVGATAAAGASGVTQAITWLLKWGLRLLLICFALTTAYEIRLYAVETYGRVIHEFDPWFNYRAAEYLAAHGREKFFKWFDHTVWYPLGRPVGTTIYPGMQFISVWIWQALNANGIDMSLNDVCVFTPAWFGVLTTSFLGLLTWESSGSIDAGIAAAIVMSMIPAHIMRSVAGAYDNECVAMCFFCSTFYFWCRSLRTPYSWYWGVVAGVSYFAMAASWGGYVYVVNMIGAHAGLLLLMGRHSAKLHRAYTLYFVTGTALACQVPVVGTAPLRSLEQMAPMAVFGWIQVEELCRMGAVRRGHNRQQYAELRHKAFFVVCAVGAAIASVLFQVGYFGPISARVRGLFVQHTRTGNPLVDSVAEHQATSPRAYWQYLNYMCYLAPIGFVLSLANLTDSRLFILLYSGVTYYFSSKMNRLVLLLGPAAAALGGVALSRGVHWAWYQLTECVTYLLNLDEEEVEKQAPDDEGTKAREEAPTSGGKKKAGTPTVVTRKRKPPKPETLEELWHETVEPFMEVYRQVTGLRWCCAGLFFLVLFWASARFYAYCQYIAEAMSSPDIIMKSQLTTGETVLVDDYREAYWWLRDNTPEDTRVMAWWDYGYQINGVANRTTIADGNTWNHEHIATLGRCLTSPESKAHNIIRHLADYVLIWAGSNGDDLAKSPHMARIANSVYSDICPGDPTCRQFGFDAQGTPTKMMRDSLLYKLHEHGKKDIRVDPELFEETYISKYGLVRIFKVLNISEESKAWAQNPENWKCDAPGSWYCPGQYPPALDKLFGRRKAFKQLEDFNVKGDDQESAEYQKAYHEKMAKRKG